MSPFSLSFSLCLGRRWTIPQGSLLLSIRGVQPPRVRGIWADTGKQVSPTGRVQGPSRELETDSRNYGGYFLGYNPLAAHLALSLLLLPLSVQFEIRDSCRLRKETRALEGHLLVCMCVQECMYYGICANISKGQSICFIYIFIYTNTYMCVCTYTRDTYTSIHMWIAGKGRTRNR